MLLETLPLTVRVVKVNNHEEIKSFRVRFYVIPKK